MRERRVCRPVRPMVCFVLPGVMATSLLAAATDATSDGGASAREILAATGVRGGLVVQVGCGDGRLAAALGAKKGFLVHGLDADPTRVEAAREHVRSAGLYGRVAVDHWTDPSRLPYADNLVNLVVAGASSRVTRAEISRVLCPNGVAYVQGADRRWTKTVKPRPRQIDEWTHYLYDASNNAVSHDAAVGPPRHLQWVGSPKWARHHDHMASMSALVAAGGRIFYIMDEGPKETILLPPVWYLVARDAFNGVVLWKRPIETWCTTMWPLKSGPSQLPRRLITDGRAVYVTMGIDAPVSVLDPATGQTRRTLEGTKFAEEMVLSNGVLFVQCLKGPSRLNSYRAKATDIWRNCRPEQGAWDRKRRTVAAIDLASGRALWKGDHSVAPLTLTADAKRVYYFDGERVVGLDRTDGRRLWQSEPTKASRSLAPAYSPTLVVHGETVLLSAETGRRRTAASMHAFDASTGRKRWSAPHLRGGHQSPEDLIVMQGLVWCGSAKPTGRDLGTGEKRKEVPPDDKAYYFHHRCHRGKATDRYLLQSRTGIEFIDPVAKHWVNNNWVRGGCIYGIMPCNGLIYAPPHSCGCYLESKLFGFNALAAASPLLDELKRGPTKGRLEKGSAYGKAPPGEMAPAARDWPTYRHDAARSGGCEGSGPKKLGAAWAADVGGRLSSVTVAGGRVYVAAVDTHTVHALDAASGKRLWAYTTGGRVDSPPTIHGGMAIFGSADGWIYAVRAADGALAWRFRAAPLDRRVVAFEQLESCWPVSGSVLVRGRTVWAVAGRSAFLDGGLRICRLEADTGRLLSETVVDYGQTDSSRELHAKLKGCCDMPTALPDILASDGRHVYLRAQPIDLEGRLESTVPLLANDQVGKWAHLFARTGFLDDAWFSRSYWIYGRGIVGLHGYPAGFEQWCEPAWYAPSGRLLVFDDKTVYGFGRKPEYQCNSAVYEYRFFAAQRTPSPEAYKEAIAKVTEKGKPKGFHSDWKLRRGYPRSKLSAANYRWAMDKPPFQARAMVLAGQTLFAAGPPDVLDEAAAFFGPDEKAQKTALAEQVAALKGQRGGRVWAIAAAGGKRLSEAALDAPPVFDGMAAANGRLYLATMDGKVLCLGASAAVAGR